MGRVNSTTFMAVNAVTQAFGHTGIDLAGSIPASLFGKSPKLGRCSVSVTLIVDSITSKAANTVAQTFWYTSTKPDRPRGFDSGRSLFTKVQNGNAAASCYSVTLIEEMSVTQVGSHFYTRRIASRRNCLTLQCREEVWRQGR